MGDTFSLKITDKVMYIQHLDRSRYDSTDLFRFNSVANVTLIEKNISAIDYQTVLQDVDNLNPVFVRFRWYVVNDPGICGKEY